METIIETARLTCPLCGAVGEHRMPTDACVFFHTCGACKRLVTPAAGDCCVFCSYADVPCPPVQAGNDCGAAP